MYKLHKHPPTFSLPVLGGRRPGDCLQVAQLATHHLGVVDGEVVIADGAPLAAVEHLHPALVVLALVARQAQLDPGRVGRNLRGAVHLLLGVGVAGRVAQVLVLGPNQWGLAVLAAGPGRGRGGGGGGGAGRGRRPACWRWRGFQQRVLGIRWDKTSLIL